METVSYDPNTIGLLSEIIHPPAELEAAKVQAIHNELYNSGPFSYQNFAVTHEGIQLSNPQEAPNAISMVNFLPDRIQIREELGTVHVDDFCKKLDVILHIACEKLSLPMIVAQQHVVRSLINSRNYADSRDFLAGVVCRLTPEALSSFERPAALFGMKLVFPQDEEHGDVHSLRIESFNQDPRSVFIEDVATYTIGVLPTDISPVAENMRATYRFVREKALGFIAGHDQPPGSGEIK
ncbi:MAG: hypothetical protein CSA62_03010 [Planctomycetota bacterium]|nr:MAG: hypothetical protein CSA62_03010 [Planctomycetota bacterium]